MALRLRVTLKRGSEERNRSTGLVSANSGVISSEVLVNFKSAIFLMACAWWDDSLLLRQSRASLLRAAGHWREHCQLYALHSSHHNWMTPTQDVPSLGIWVKKRNKSIAIGNIAPFIKCLTCVRAAVVAEKFFVNIFRCYNAIKGFVQSAKMTAKNIVLVLKGDLSTKLIRRTDGYRCHGTLVRSCAKTIPPHTSFDLNKVQFVGENSKCTCRDRLKLHKLVLHRGPSVG